MEQYRSRISKICRNPLCFVPCIVVALIVAFESVYIGIGIGQCFEPTDGIETKSCGSIGDELFNNNNEFINKTYESIPVHQLGINLNVSKLEYNSGEKWKLMYDDYTLYDATMARNIIVQYYPHLLALYDSYPDDVQRADLARIAILHHYGGIYTDLDAFPKTSARMIRKAHAGVIKKAYVPVGTGNVSVNFLFITNRNNSFLEYTMNSFEEFNNRWKWIPLPYLRVFLTTGPCAVTVCLRRWKEMWEEKGVVPAPDVARMVSPSCFVNHLAGRVWLSLDGIIINFIGDYPFLFIYFLIFVATALVIVWIYFARKRPAQNRQREQQVRHQQESEQELIQVAEDD